MNIVWYVVKCYKARKKRLKNINPILQNLNDAKIASVWTHQSEVVETEPRKSFFPLTSRIHWNMVRHHVLLKTKKYRTVCKSYFCFFAINNDIFPKSQPETLVLCPLFFTFLVHCKLTACSWRPQFLVYLSSHFSFIQPYSPSTSVSKLLFVFILSFFAPQLHHYTTWLSQKNLTSSLCMYLHKFSFPFPRLWFINSKHFRLWGP